MKMQKFVIFMIAGLMILPVAFMGASARPTIVNIAYSSQAGDGWVSDMTLVVHAFGFPGETLDWHGTFVIPSNDMDLPPGTSNINIFQSTVSDTSVSLVGTIDESTNPDLVGLLFYGSAYTGGSININFPALVYIQDSTATVVINM